MEWTSNFEVTVCIIISYRNVYSGSSVFPAMAVAVIGAKNTCTQLPWKW